MLLLFRTADALRQEQEKSKKWIISDARKLERLEIALVSYKAYAASGNNLMSVSISSGLLSSNGCSAIASSHVGKKREHAN